MNAGAAKASTSSGLQSHFELFGLSPAFRLDREALEKAYREIQSQVHPDRFAHAGDAERRASLQWTTRVNEAYRVLKDPVQRARHILELHGLDVAFETDTRMPADFLGQQLELREELERAVGSKDAAALDRLRSDLSGSRRSIEGQIGEAIDAKKDYARAAELARKL
ncbi:MAG TPA: Fe-S protein assembly co-chaperone HscB, partial [Burkholderiales bacterium]